MYIGFLTLRSGPSLDSSLQLTTYLFRPWPMSHHLDYICHVSSWFGHVWIIIKLPRVSLTLRGGAPVGSMPEMAPKPLLGGYLGPHLVVT